MNLLHVSKKWAPVKMPSTTPLAPVRLPVYQGCIRQITFQTWTIWMNYVLSNDMQLTTNFFSLISHSFKSLIHLNVASGSSNSQKPKAAIETRYVFSSGLCTKLRVNYHQITMFDYKNWNSVVLDVIIKDRSYKRTLRWQRTPSNF